MTAPPLHRPALSIWLSAGEVSGDRLAARVARAMTLRDPGIRLTGFAGPAMRREGVFPAGDAMTFALSGWSAVVPRLPWLVLALQGAVRRALREKPDLVVAFDAPGFHRVFLQRIRKAGLATAWVAPPQLWAWRHRVEPVLQGMETFPLHEFEQEALRRQGARVRWVGFPGDIPSTESCGSREFLALLPGSRPAWARRHRDLFLEAAHRSGLPLAPMVAIPSGRKANTGEMECSALWGRSALALALPGTGVLEAALAGIPTVVAARPGWIDRSLAKSRLVDGVLSLPNRILGEELLPEFLGTPTAEILAEALRTLWLRRQQVARRLAKLPAKMGEDGALERLSEALLQLAVRPRH